MPPDDAPVGPDQVPPGQFGSSQLPSGPTGSGQPGPDQLASTQWQGLDSGLLSLRRLECLLLVGLPTLAFAVWLGATARVLQSGLALAGGVVVLVLALSAVRRRFLAWSWSEREDDLLLRRGVLVRRTSVVPYGRMQYVDVTAGPLDRRFGLAKVVLHTAAAATDASIPGLSTADADRLRDRLAALGEARAAGV